MCFSVAGVILCSATSSWVILISIHEDGVTGSFFSLTSGSTSLTFCFGVSLFWGSILVCYSGRGGFDCYFNSFSNSSSKVIIFFLIGTSSIFTTFLLLIGSGTGFYFTLKSMIGIDYFSMNFFNACFVFEGSGFSS